MFQKIAPWFVYVFFSMLYLGNLKRALTHTCFYLSVVILVNVVFLIIYVISHDSMKRQKKNTYQTMCHDDNLS